MSKAHNLVSEMVKLGLVLGGGGLIGLGYHAGVLKALDERGVETRGADVIVGTSAGAIIGAYLAAGWAQTDFYEYALGRHQSSIAEGAGEVGRLFTPMWRSRSERVRRSIGSAFAMASSRGLWKTGGRLPAAALRRVFPSGLYSSEETRERLCADLPREWPRPGVLLCAAELYSGKRLAFGMPGSPPAPFPEAALASTAIPGIFPPVRIGDHHYVDGGVVTATSLDFAGDAGCDAILCIAPLGYRRDVSLPLHDPRKWPSVAVRVPYARMLKREVVAARAKGIEVLVIRPWMSDLAVHGTNSMRHHDRAALTDGARVGTHRLLDSVGRHAVLSAFGAKVE